ncbi:MAG TPA: LamG-like jellyroll fold domain-containing protein [Luteolibacter sp.]
MFIKTADFTTATLSPATFPAVSPASGGLTLTTLGSQTAGRSASYSNGVWTMSGLGNGTWSDTSDDCQFAYKQMTGDCAMVAKITSNQYPSAQARAGLMIRDNLTAPVGQRAWIGALSAPTMKMESHMRGWTENWGGGGYDDRSHDWPPGLPYWIKIERRDKQIATFASPDGTSWSPLNCTYYGNLPSTLYIGLFVSSGTTTTNTATFENVAFTGGTGGLVTTPGAPVGLIAATSDKAVTVRWLASFGATSYDLLRTTTPGSGYAVIASDLTSTKTSYVDTTAAAGTNYYYVVRAKNSAGTSGNSAEFAASHSQLVPQMANLAFGGTTSASVNTGPQVGGSDTAFDGNPASKWFGWNAPTGWLQYDFGAGNAQVVKRYTINSADVPARDPKDWLFQGSQDGSTWTTLDTQNGQTFAINMGMNIYPIGNTTAYRYYRINITANNGATGVAISELGLWGDSGRTLRDGRYRLVSRKGNKVLDLVNGGTADGTDAIQWSWNGGDDQKWDLAHLGNGQYKLTGVASGKLLEVTGASTSNGAAVQISTSNSSASQKWTVIPAGDGTFKLLNVNSGKAMDVSSGSTADGAGIIQWPDSGAVNQRWMFSIGVTPQPIPSVPIGLAGTPASIQQINLTWTASPGAFHYNVKRATVDGGPYTTIAYDVNTTSYADTGLTAATTYYYVVSAVNGSGESADSAQASATTTAGPPAAPAGLTTLMGTNQVILNWTATGGATSYTIKRATAPGGLYTTLASGVTATNYTDTSRTSDVAYYYVVVAVNAFGSSPDSAEVVVGPGNLIAHLGFDENSGTLAADSSGFANDATLYNGPVFAAGFMNNGLSFTAASTQYARLPSGIASGLTDFTLSTWVKLNSSSNNNRIFDFGTGTDNYMELCPKTSVNGFMRYEIRSGGTIQQINTTYLFPTGVWTHVALRQSGSTGTLYINGTSVGTSSGLTLKPSNLGTTTLNYIGKSMWANDAYLDGTTDDFRVYAQALSVAEIDALAHPAAGAPTQLAVVPGNSQATLTWLPNATDTHTVKRSTTSGGPYTTIATGVTSPIYTDTGLTNGLTYYYVVSGANSGGSAPDSAEASVTPHILHVHLKFDESSGTVAADSSDRGQNATLVNGPAFAAGKINNALCFTATSSQYAKLPSGVVNGLTDFTVSTWIKVNAFATWQRIFDFGSNTSNYMDLAAQGPAGAGRPRFAIRTPSVAEQTIDSTIALTTGTWAHVAVVRSGTTVSLYVNGSIAGSGTVTLTPSDLGATTQNYLGKSQYNDPYLNAALDDFRIYSQALNASDIALLAAPPAAPQNLAATPGPLSLNLSWNAVPNATGYTVKYATMSGGPYATLATGLTETSCFHSGLTYGTTYYYVVSSANSICDGPFSTEIAATSYTLVENWRLTHFGNAANSGAAADAADPDADGMTNIQEFTAGTDPGNAASVFRVSGMMISGNEVLLSFPTVAGKTYRLECSDTLLNDSWVPVLGNISGTGDVIQITDPVDSLQSRRFYRIAVVP